MHGIIVLPDIQLTGNPANLKAGYPLGKLILKKDTYLNFSFFPILFFEMNNFKCLLRSTVASYLAAFSITGYLVSGRIPDIIKDLII